MSELHSLRGLAWQLAIPVEQLLQLASEPDEHYDPFPLKRKGKKPRNIDNPLGWLKSVQRVMRRRVLVPHPVDESARACVAGGSPLKHARVVTGMKHVAETDLKNCYPTITNDMVFNLYRSLGYGVRPASVLTRLSTWERHLPQGAPTSDLLANLFMRPLDDRIKAIAGERGLVYSRCMDGFVVAGNGRTREALGLVIKEIRSVGLAVRGSKTRNAGAGGEQIVAGYNVNTPQGPKVSKSKVQEIRTDVFKLVTCHTRGEDITLKLLSVRGSLAYLRPTNPGVVRRLENQMTRAGIRLAGKPKRT